MKRLFDTTITKKDTCLSYALKRTNTETTIEFAEDLEKEFHLIPVKDIKLEIGDIVAWRKKEDIIYSGVSINDEGAITHSPVDTKYHIGVVEGPTHISDLTRSANAYYIPSIRMRLISLTGGDYQTFCPVPDFVIRKKVN